MAGRRKENNKMKLETKLVEGWAIGLVIMHVVQKVGSAVGDQSRKKVHKHREGGERRGREERR